MEVGRASVVPLGEVLGPLLLPLYINVFGLRVECKSILHDNFFNDTKMGFSVRGMAEKRDFRLSDEAGKKRLMRSN